MEVMNDILILVIITDIEVPLLLHEKSGKQKNFI